MIEVRREDGRVALLPFDLFEEEVRLAGIRADTLVRFGPVTGEDFVPAGHLELWRSVEDSSRTRFERGFDLRRLCPVTLLFSCFLGLVFLWQLHQGPALGPSELVAQGAKSMPHQQELGQWWRLLTASFLHVGWMHLVPNLLFLLYVGRNVESVLGWGGTLLIIALSGTGSMALSSSASDAFTVGASGVTFAFFGAVVAVGWRYSSWLPRGVRAKYGWPIVPFVVYFLVAGMMWSAVDHFCHLGGLAIGGALGLFLPSPLEQEVSSARRTALLSAALAVLTVASVTVLLPLAWRVGLLPGPSLARDEVQMHEAGVRIRPPRDWAPVLRSVPGEGWSSRTGMAQLSIQTWVEELGPLSRPEVVLRWQEELETRAHVLPRRPFPAPSELGLDPEWLVFEADLVTEGERLRLLRLGWLRGAYLTTVDFLHPIDVWTEYEGLRLQVISTIEFQKPATVVRALDELLGDTLPSQPSVLPFLDVVASRPITDPEGTLRLAAELVRVGDVDRSTRLLEALRGTSAELRDLDYWQLWISHHLEGRHGVLELAAARRLRSLRPDSVFVLALAWSVHQQAGEGEQAGVLLEEIALRWPERAALLSERGRLRSVERP